MAPFDAKGRWFRRPPSWVVCRECGRRFDASAWVNAGELEEEQLCEVDCKWSKLEREKNHPNVIRADGIHYISFPNDDERWRGPDSRLYLVRWLDAERLPLITRNVWIQGVIPLRWRSRLPDNAELGDA